MVKWHALSSATLIFHTTTIGSSPHSLLEKCSFVSLQELSPARWLIPSLLEPVIALFKIPAVEVTRILNEEVVLQHLLTNWTRHKALKRIGIHLHKSNSIHFSIQLLAWTALELPASWCHGWYRGSWIPGTALHPAGLCGWQSRLVFLSRRRLWGFWTFWWIDSYDSRWKLSCWELKILLIVMAPATNQVLLSSVLKVYMTWRSPHQSGHD